MSSIHVFLTRPQGRNGSVPERLRAMGMRVYELPALELRPLAPTQGVPSPGDYDIVVFVSRYAVQRYLRLLADVADGVPVWPVDTIAATVGASSASALIRSGIIPHSRIVHPSEASSQDSESLLAILLERRIRMKRVLIVRGTQGREWLARSLTERGARVDFLPVYERVPAAWQPGIRTVLAQALERPAHCVFLLTSSEGILAMARRLGESGLSAQWPNAAFVVIHERIGATLQSVLASQPGYDARRLALCMPDDDSIVEAIRAVARLTAEP